ncbi:MAG: hypothetical protein GY772_16565 [bacterium]|nr:hypothetical protein [bacterium]
MKSAGHAVASTPSCGIGGGGGIGKGPAGPGTMAAVTVTMSGAAAPELAAVAESLACASPTLPFAARAIFVPFFTIAEDEDRGRSAGHSSHSEVAGRGGGGWPKED